MAQTELGVTDVDSAFECACVWGPGLGPRAFLNVVLLLLEVEDGAAEKGNALLRNVPWYARNAPKNFFSPLSAGRCPWQR